MTSKVTKLFGFIISVIIVFNITATAFAESDDSRYSDTIYQSAAQGIVYDIVDAINLHDWDTYTSLQCEANKADYIYFFGNKENENSNAGLFNVKSASVYEIKELSLENITAFTQIDEYLEQYNDVKAFYVGIEYSVNEESKYYFDGINYNLVIVGYENRAWKIVEMSDAPVESFVDMGLGFSSKAEGTALDIVEARIAGAVIGGNGQFIEKISNESSFQSTGVRANAVDEHARPDYVRVYRTGSSTVQSIDLYTYVKCVLPNEWIASWPIESLKSGAMACKMYGWYHTYHPKWSSLNADVKDTAVDQIYKPGTEHADSTTAIDDVGSIGIENSNGNIFETQYLAGSQNTAGNANTGKISQYGSKYLADNSYGYMDICEYYYNYSDKSTGEIDSFTY